MNYFLLAACLLTGCARAAKSFPRTGFGIVHGRTVTETNRLSKSVVALVAAGADGQALCTGTILDEETILTAAHCVESPVRLVVAFGTELTGTDQDTLREADDYIQHPSWEERSRAARVDLALVHFKGGLPAGYVPIRLAAVDADISPGSPVLMMGYGVTNGVRNKGAGRLRQVKSLIQSQDVLGQVMVDGEEHGVCFGDSGGPAFVSVDGEWMQFGVAHAVASHACDTVSFQTSILSAEPWIRKTAPALAREASSGRRLSRFVPSRP